MTPNDSCPEPHILDLLIDGELASDEEARWSEHLGCCADCQRALESQSSGFLLARRIPELRSSQDPSPLMLSAVEMAKALRSVGAANDDSKPDDLQSIVKWIDWDMAGYEPLAILGRGGMGVVIKARDIGLNRLVALKFLSPMLAADSTSRERFLREAQTAATLKHANTVTIYSVAGSEKTPYFAMEYVEDGSLQDLLDDGPLTLEAAVRLGKQIARGLAAAHACGIVHRDVKPSNILVEEGGERVKLSDFGLARLAGNSPLTQSGMIVGTPEFLAPELLENGLVDHRSDLFSLGSVLYLMCTGVSPFAANSLPAILHRISQATPTPVHNHDPTIPIELAQIIHRLLGKDPAERFQSAEDVLAALDGCLAAPAAPPIAPTRQATGQAPRRAQRHQPSHSKKASSPLWVVYLALGAVLTTMLASLLVFANGKPKPEPAGENASNDDSESQSGALPFLLVRSDGSARQPFDSLQEALEEAQSGDRVELLDEGPFTITDTIRPNGDITIAAAAGGKPLIRFEPETEPAEMIAIATSHALELIDLQLEIDSEDDEEETTFVHLEGGGLEALRCRFLTRTSGRCIATDAAERVLLTDCELYALDGPAVALDLNEGTEVALSNCFVAGLVGIQIELDAASQVTVDRSTFATLRAFELFPDPQADSTAQLSVTATQNLFKSRDSLVFVDLDEELRRDETAAKRVIRRTLQWSGRRNVFSGPFVRTADNESSVWAESWASWQTLVSEKDSGLVAEPFRATGDALWARLRAGDSLETLFDLSPAVNAVGAVRR